MSEFEQVFSVDLGCFGSGVTRCEHLVPGSTALAEATGVLQRHELKWQYVSKDAGKSKYPQIKTKTCAVADKCTKQIVAFGWRAHDLFFADGGSDKYFFYEFFKPHFSRDGECSESRGLSRDCLLWDETGEGLQLPICELFAAALRALVKHSIDGFNKSRALAIGSDEKMADVSADECLFVCTLPAVWPLDSVSYFKDACRKAEIRHFQVLREPIAAAQFAAFLSDDGRAQIAEAKVFVVLDCGGGTVDSACVKLTSADAMAEVRHCDGVAIGGMAVDGAFVQMLVCILGSDLTAAIRSKYPRSLSALRKAFNDEKLRVSLALDSRVLSLPRQFTAALKKQLGSDWKPRFAQMCNDYSATGKCGVRFEDNKLCIPLDTWRKLHESVLADVCALLRRVLANAKVRVECGGEPVVVVCGGFSLSCFLRERLSAEFAAAHFVFPKSPELAVLRGATIAQNLEESRFPISIGMQISRVWRSGMPTVRCVHSMDSPTGHEIPGCFFPIIKVNTRYVDVYKYVFRKFKIPVGTTVCKCPLLYSAADKCPRYCDDPSVKPLALDLEINLGTALRKTATLKMTFTIRDDFIKAEFVHPVTGKSSLIHTELIL